MGNQTQTRVGLFTADADTSWSFENFEVERISKDDAMQFVKQHHYSGGMGNAPIPYGIRQYATGELVGVIAFHTPISENVRRMVFGDEHKDRVTELHRMAIHPDAPPNTATWFISRALDRLKKYRPQTWAVLSHADRTEGHDGTVYQAASADYTGTTRETTFYRDENGRLRSPRQNGERIDREKARTRGWVPEKRDAKHRYVFWTPDPYQTKNDLREKSKLEPEPYPNE